MRCGALYFGPPCTTPVAYCGQCVTPAALLHPIHQDADRRLMIRGRHRPGKRIFPIHALGMPSGIRQTYALDPAGKKTPGGRPGLEQRKLDAR